MIDRHNLLTGPRGFDQAQALERWLSNFSPDGVLTAAQTEQGRRLLDDNLRDAGVHPFREVADRLSESLATGVMTLEARLELLFVVRRYTLGNPYIDRLRAGLDALLAHLSKVSEHGKLTHGTSAALSGWLETWEALGRLWPYDEVSATAATILARQQVTDEPSQLQELLRRFPAASARTVDTSALLAKGICAVNPQLAFPQKTFVFTGESQICERKILQDLALRRGGLCSDRVTGHTDYLVVCDASSPYWPFACYGRQVEHAHQIRRDGQRVELVHELDFWDAIADTTTAKA